MPLRLTKAWQDLTAENVALLHGYLGVYEIQDERQETVLVGYAGGKSPFGLRGLLEQELASRGSGFRFRLEVNMQYQTRYRELLMVHVADQGSLPRENQRDAIILGRLTPAS